MLNFGGQPERMARASARRAAREISKPVLDRLWARVDDLARRRVEPVQRELAALRAEVAGMRSELDALAGRIEPVEVELHRIGAQQAAVDTRMAGLERPVVSGIADERTVELAQEIRSEHARVRARLTAIGQYEERLGRLEAALNPGGDRP